MAETITLNLAAIHANMKKSSRQRRTDGTVTARPFSFQKRIANNPTATIPDVPGFFALHKAEVKKDTKDIEKASQYMCFTDSDSDEEGDEDAAAIRSSRPGPAPEASITAKKNRYASWTTDTSRIQYDMNAQSNAIAGVKRDLSALETQENEWLSSFELARHRVNDAMYVLREDNIILNNTATYIMTGLTKNKRRAKTSTRHSSLRDFASSLQDSQVNLEETLNQYLSNADDHPIVEVHLDTSIEVAPFHRMNKNEVSSALEEISSTVMKNWVCGGCAFNNIHSGSTEYVCAGCGKLSEEADVLSAVNTSTMTTSTVPLPSQASKALKQYLLHLEQQVHSREGNIHNVEVFFPEEDYVSIEAPHHPVLDEKQVLKMKSAELLSKAEMERLAHHVLEDRGMEKWRALIEESSRLSPFPGGNHSNGTAARSRRRGVSAIPMASFVMPRTPRGVPLFISPLSQHADKYLGAIMGNTCTAPGQPLFTSDAMIPTAVRVLERDTFLKNEIKGLVRIAERDVQVVLSTMHEWQQQGLEASSALKKAESMHILVKQEEVYEMVRYKNGLLFSSTVSAECKDNGSQEGSNNGTVTTAPASPRHTKGGASKKSNKFEDPKLLFGVDESSKGASASSKVKSEVKTAVATAAEKRKANAVSSTGSTSAGGVTGSSTTAAAAGNGKSTTSGAAGKKTSLSNKK